MNRTHLTTLLFATGVVAGAVELVDAWTLGNLTGTLMALAVGALFVGLAATWRRTRSRAAAGGLAVLFALELSMVPMFDRASLSDWVVQLAFASLSLAGLGPALVVLATRTRRRDQVPTP
jgi:hypothetical protein